MRIGILGAGKIAGTLAKTMGKMEDVECYGVAARELKRAEVFAEAYGFEKAYGSYEELVQDEKVELVYIATPHSHHFEQMKLCVIHGKPVICEKSFTMNAKQAKEILTLSRQKQVMVTEAIWTRYMPSRKLIDDMLSSGIIGEVRTLTANLSYKIDHVERIMRPELAGGALLDVGVYPINFARMHFGTAIERVESSVMYTETGVDGQNTITLMYKDGKMASLTSGIYGRSDRKGIFYGTKGYLVVENINNPRLLSAYDMEDRLLKEVKVPEQISGYEYEIRAAMEAVEQGRISCAAMPHEEIIGVMELMDQLRVQWNIVYPQEQR